jgi:hypothetical protein
MNHHAANEKSGRGFQPMNSEYHTLGLEAQATQTRSKP